MRILHVTHQYLPEFVGGVELYTQTLSTEQARLGHQVSIFTRQNQEGEGLSSSPEILYSTPQNSPDVYRAWNGIMSHARRFAVLYGDKTLLHHFNHVLDLVDPSIVHFQHLMGLPHQLVHAVLAREIPYVVSLHDYWWICANANLLTNYDGNRCDGPRAHVNCTRCVIARASENMNAMVALSAPAIWGGLTYRHSLLKTILQRAQSTIAPSEFVREWYCQQGISADQISVIPLGLDRAESSVSEAGVPSVDRTFDYPLRFLYVGGLAGIKGVHTVVEAFNRIQAMQTPDAVAELWIVGDETKDPHYMSVLRANASDRIKFLGRRSHDEVVQMMAQCHVLLAPSIWDETFSFVVHEALAANCPVFASDVGNLSNLIEHGENGYLLPPEDSKAWQMAMQAIIDEPDKLELLEPRKSNHQPQTYSVQENAVEVLKLYEKVMEEKDRLA